MCSPRDECLISGRAAVSVRLFRGLLRRQRRPHPSAPAGQTQSPYAAAPRAFARSALPVTTMNTIMAISDTSPTSANAYQR